MEFKLAFFQSQNSLYIRHFKQNLDENETYQYVQEKVITPDFLEEENVQLIFLGEKNKDLESEFLTKEQLFCCLVPPSAHPLTLEEFRALTLIQATLVFRKMHAQWILGHNLQTLEDIFALSHHLHQLGRKNRTEFFEELWFFLKRNLGASSLRIIYHDLESLDDSGDNKDNKISESKQKEKYRPKLIHSYISGTRLPKAQRGGDTEKKMMEQYVFTANATSFQTLSFDENKGEFLALARIDHGPVLIMANLYQFGKMQHSLLKALFSGLQTLP